MIIDTDTFDWNQRKKPGLEKFPCCLIFKFSCLLKKKKKKEIMEKRDKREKMEIRKQDPLVTDKILFNLWIIRILRKKSTFQNYLHELLVLLLLYSLKNVKVPKNNGKNTTLYEHFNSKMIDIHSSNDLTIQYCLNKKNPGSSNVNKDKLLPVKRTTWVCFQAVSHSAHADSPCFKR